MSRKRRESFVFYRTFAEVVEELPPDQQLQFLKAIINYGLDYKKPQLTGISHAMFKVFVPLIDANWRRYLNGCQGGRDKNKHKPKENQNETEMKPYYNYNSNDNLNSNDNGNNAEFNPTEVFG